MKCVEDENMQAFYNNMQIDNYEVWHCQLGVRAEVDGSKLKNELKKSSLYNRYNPLQYFRDNIVFQMPAEMTLLQAADELGIEFDEFLDLNDSKASADTQLKELPRSPSGIIDVYCTASKTGEKRAKKCDYVAKPQILQLFEAKGGIKDIIQAALASVGQYKNAKSKEMWSLWLSEVESFSKLPSFFDIFSNDRAKEDVIYQLLTGKLDEKEDD